MSETDQKAGPLDELRWINTQLDQLTARQARALFEARLRGQFGEALEVTGLSRKRGLAITRAENEARGRVVRWGDL